jgi:hypothetical protein
MVDLNRLTPDDRYLLKVFAEKKGFKDYKLIDCVIDPATGWKAFFMETLVTMNVSTTLGKMKNAYDTNRYLTLEIKPKFVGGHTVIHEGQNHNDNRRYAEEQFDQIKANIHKYHKIGHL